MKSTLRTLIAVALGLVATSSALAVNLDPGGRGQVLIYPYFTVNKQQQTLVSVTNTSPVSQALKVRIREGYNGREVAEFNVFLSPFDSWTGTIFALRDAGIDSNGAGILNRDTSCTAPDFAEGDGLVNGAPYVAFKTSGFLTPDDGGPYTSDRTREGYIEIYAMANIAAPLSDAIAHGSTGAPPTGCAQVRALLPDNTALSTPAGGLMGSVGIIDVARGTFLTARAEALAAFTASNLFGALANGSNTPNLGSVNDGTGALAGRATARIVDEFGIAQSLTYPGTDPRSRKIDAVSAVLMAERVLNEYQVSVNLGAGSDWLLTMPTKPHYTDAVYTGGGPIPPFETTYSGAGTGIDQYSSALFSRYYYTRNGRLTGIVSPTICPTGCDPNANRVVNVVPISRTALTDSKVLGSKLVANVHQGFDGDTSWDSGWMDVTLHSSSLPHALLPSAEGKVLRGLPVVGYWASNIVNNNVSNGVLANYASAVRHATSVTCVKASDGTPCA